MIIITLPLLLAGPIIRRTEFNQVYIWLTTSKYVRPEAVFYSITINHDQSYKYTPLRTITEVNYIQSGKNLYSYLLRITPYGSHFPLDSLIGYNIKFYNRYGITDLKDMNLLNKENPNHIVYGNLEYPSFVIPNELPSNIFYGSCQKPHGKRVSAITSADKNMENHVHLLDERPNALFLMGDQIYADDVADPIFYKIKQVSQAIVGEDENNLLTIEPQLKKRPFRRSIDQINGRQFIMGSFAKFTSNHASNHLIRFQEYVSMYLLTLGPALWENNQAFPTFEELLETDEYYLFFPKFKKRKRKNELKKRKKQYESQLKEINDFLPTLPAFRRVLANVPTYMIFDDHDITDDWNISQEWIDGVNHSKLGKHVISNGLAAYFLFQGWGNDPNSFKNNLPYFHAEFNYHRKYSTFSNDWLDRLPNLQCWSFVAPTSPQALFLDIRTMREFDYRPKALQIGRTFQEGKTAPQLIGKKGWQITNHTLTSSSWKTGDPLIIVSPTPLYGLGIIESFLKKFVYPLRAIGLPVRYALDFEAWKYNGIGFNRFIQHIIRWNPEASIILSGDVHYASAVRSNIFIQRKHRLTIHQFTSSPIHNMSFTGIWGMLIKIIVSFKSYSRRKKKIFRSYDKGNNLQFGNVTEKNKNHILWYEEIKYLSPPSGKILHNQNNIGLLTITKDFILNRLLKVKRTSTYNKVKRKRSS